MRTVVMWLVAAVVLAALNGLIAHKESVLASGQTVYMRLAPVDPRSLIQGDYMVLRYALARGIGWDSPETAPSSGYLVIRLDEKLVARFVRFHAGEPLAPGELLLRYRKRGRIRIGAEAFFFQEGHADRYSRARYGELKVAPGGDSVLVGLRAEDLQPLGDRK